GTGLHALHGDRQVQAVGEGHDPFDDLEVDGVGRELLHALGEGTVQLQNAHRQPPQVGQVGVAGAEVVQRYVDAHLGEPPQGLEQVVVRADQRRLGELQAEDVRLHAHALQDLDGV